MPRQPTDVPERILKAAIELILEKGYEKTRAIDITTKAGTSASQLSTYFPTKKYGESRHGVLVELFQIGWRGIIEDIAKPESQKSTDALSKIANIFSAQSSAPLKACYEIDCWRRKYAIQHLILLSRWQKLFA